MAAIGWFKGEAVECHRQPLLLVRDEPVRSVRRKHSGSSTLECVHQTGEALADEAFAAPFPRPGGWPRRRALTRRRAVGSTGDARWTILAQMPRPAVRSAPASPCGGWGDPAPRAGQPAVAAPGWPVRYARRSEGVDSLTASVVRGFGRSARGRATRGAPGWLRARPAVVAPRRVGLRREAGRMVGPGGGRVAPSRRPRWHPRWAGPQLRHAPTPGPRLGSDWPACCRAPGRAGIAGTLAGGQGPPSPPPPRDRARLPAPRPLAKGEVVFCGASQSPSHSPAVVKRSRPQPRGRPSCPGNPTC